MTEEIRYSDGARNREEYSGGGKFKRSASKPVAAASTVGAVEMSVVGSKVAVVGAAEYQYSSIQIQISRRSYSSRFRTLSLQKLGRILSPLESPPVYQTTLSWT